MEVRKSGGVKDQAHGARLPLRTPVRYTLVSFRSCVSRSRALIGFWIKPLDPLSKHLTFMYGNALIAMINVPALIGFSRIT